MLSGRNGEMHSLGQLTMIILVSALSPETSNAHKHLRAICQCSSWFCQHTWPILRRTVSIMSIICRLFTVLDSPLGGALMLFFKRTKSSYLCFEISTNHYTHVVYALSITGAGISQSHHVGTGHPNTLNMSRRPYGEGGLRSLYITIQP